MVGYCAVLIDADPTMATHMDNDFNTSSEAAHQDAHDNALHEHGAPWFVVHKLQVYLMHYISDIVLKHSTKESSMKGFSPSACIWRVTETLLIWV